MKGEASAWRNLRSKFRDKIARKDDRQRVRGKRRVNSLNELLLSSKDIPIFFRTYRDLSHKDFLITFHPLFHWRFLVAKRAPFPAILGAMPRGAAGGCAAACPGGSGLGGILGTRACANGPVSKWKAYFQ